MASLSPRRRAARQRLASKRAVARANLREEVRAEVMREGEFEDHRRRALAESLAVRILQSATEDRRRPGWYEASHSGDVELSHRIPLLRARSRLMATDDPKAVGLVHKEKSNIIGLGFTPQVSMPKRVMRRWNLDDAAVRAMSDNAEEFLRETVLSGRDIDWRRERTFFELQRCAVDHWRKDGDHYIRYHLDTQRVCGFKIQLIEADSIGTPPEKSNNANVREGHVYDDKTGEWIGCYVAIAHPGGFGGNTGYEFVPARNELGLPQIVRLGEPHRESATRCLPWLHAALLSLNDVGDYKYSELKRKVVEACVLFAQTMQNTEMDLVEGMNQQTGWGKGNNGPRRADVQIPNNTVIPLEPGEKLETINADRPGSNYEPFTMSIDRDIGQAVGRSFERVANNYGAANFAATRVSGKEDDLEDGISAKLFADAILDAVFVWGMYALAAEEANLAYRDLTCKWNRYIKASWDPERDAAAAGQRIEIGISSRAKEAAKIGNDAEDIAREEARLEKFTDEAFEAVGAKRPDKNPPATDPTAAAEAGAAKALSKKDEQDGR